MYMTTPNVVTVMSDVYDDIAMSPLPIVGVILIRVVHGIGRKCVRQESVVRLISRTT